MNTIKIRLGFALIGAYFLCILSANAQVWKPDYDSARVKFNRGEIEATTAWLENFLPHFKTASDFDTVAYYEMVHLLGRCYLKQGYNVNAEEMFKEDIDFFKTDTRAVTKATYASSLIYLGLLKYNLKKYNEAEGYFKEVIKTKSELNILGKGLHIALIHNLATIANTKKEYVRADSLYDKLISMKKDFYGANSLELASTLTTKGTLCKKMGRYSEAEPYYKQALDIRKAKQGEKSPGYIFTLERMGDLYQVQGRYADLETVDKQIVSLCRDTYGPKSIQYCQALNDLADLYHSTTRFAEAEPLCQQVIDIIGDSIGSNNLDYCKAQINLGSLYKDMNRFVDSEIQYKSALSIYEAIVGENHESYIKALVGLASLYRTIGKTADAEPLYMKAMSIYKNTIGTTTMTYADFLNDYALYFDEMGHYEQAELYYKQSLEITEKLKGDNDPNYASTLDNLATHYLLTGHVEQAEPIFMQALKIRKERLGVHHPLYASSLNNLGNLYESTGRIAEAKAKYLEAIDIISQVYGKNNFNYANAIDNLSDVLEKEGNYDEAEKYVRESMQINKLLFGENHVYYTTALNNLALLQTKQKKPEEAEKLYKENIQKMKAAVGDEHPSYASALSNLADLYESMERYKESEDLYEQALKIRKDKLGVNHRQYTITLTHLAGLYTATNDYDKADLLWESSLNNYLKEIKLFFPSMSEKEKQQFYKTISAEFEQFNTYALLRAPSNPQVLSNMYNYQLATKALILNASNKVRQKILASRDTSLTNLYKKWLQQKEVLSKLYSLSKEEIAKEKLNLDSLENLANDLEKKLSLRSDLFKNTNDTLTYTWKHVQKKLKDEEAAIEMIRFRKFDFRKSGQITDSIYYAALIITKDTRKNPELVVAINGNDLEKKYLNYYKNVIKFKIEDENSYLYYWKKVNNGLAGIKKVYLSPDGVYNQLNLNTIKNLETNKYIIEENDIELVSNTKDLVTQYAVRNSRKQIIIFGNPDYTSDGTVTTSTTAVASTTETPARNYNGILSPLPGTEKEANMIAGMMRENKWSTRVELGTNANEKNLKMVNNPKVLHIATHGFFDKDLELSKAKGVKTESITRNKLLRSGLMLAGASVTIYNKKNAIFQADKIEKTTEDGILTAYEAMNMNLDSTDLVVLSACETGLGDVENGEGVYGLQRAFIIAGAESIVLSLWKVDDATTQKLMTLFYNEWLKSGNKRQAFRNAQNMVKQQFPDPYYWGAFVMVGE
ncbi:MAG TPA: tetratricopeptide repeat protein [Cytophagaceae bacterium]|nr:tetratricopeptide repeat protein [Cytophagaceae bacterium]